MTNENLKPSTVRMRRLNARKKLGISLPQCKWCGRKITAPEGIALQLCSDCRRYKTPEGRKKALESAYKSIHRQQRLKSLGVNLDEANFDWQSPDELPRPTDKEVLVETIRGALLIGRHDPHLRWIDPIDGKPVKIKHWTELKTGH